MLEFSNFKKYSHPPENEKLSKLIVGKYKSPAETQNIYARLKPTRMLHGLNLYIAPEIYETSHDFTKTLEPYILLASPQGEELLNNRQFFMLLEQNPTLLPGATEVTGNFHSKVYRVPYPILSTTLYVKTPILPGYEPFETLGMILLQSQGFHIPDHLITTQFRSVTEQAEGVELSQFTLTPEITKQMKKFQYLVDQTIKSLASRGLWHPYNGSGYVSSLFSPDHFFIRDWEGFLSDDHLVLKNSVTIVDAVTFATNDINRSFAN